jgi:hypothetical protein
MQTRMVHFHQCDMLELLMHRHVIFQTRLSGKSGELVLHCNSHSICHLTDLDRKESTQQEEYFSRLLTSKQHWQH